MFDCIDYNEALNSCYWVVGEDDFRLYWNLACADDYSGFVFINADQKPLHKAYISN